MFIRSICEIWERSKCQERRITSKHLAFFLTALYIVSLIPLFIIAKYDYPSADDFTFGAVCRVIWLESHSLGAVFTGAVRHAWNYYFDWAGCVSSSFFMALQPAIFGESVYRITPFLMIGVVSISTIYLMRMIFVIGMKCNKWYVQSITMIVLFLTIQRMPEPGEGLFWYNGAIHYTFLHGLSLFFYGKLFSAFIETDHRKKKWDAVVAAVLGIITGMGNYMTALNAGIVLALLVVWLLGAKKIKRQRILLLPVVLFYLSFVLNIIAPGNAVRAAGSNGMNPLKAVFVSFYYTLDLCLGEWSGWETAILIAVIAILFWNASGTIEFAFPCPLLVMFLNFGVLSAMSTPPLFGTGSIEAGRIQSLLYIMYILLLSLTVCYVVGWVKKKLSYGVNREISQGKNENELSDSNRLVLCAFISFFFFGSVLCVVPDPGYYAFSLAIEDLCNGSAAAYGEKMEERNRIYNVSVGEDVEVEPLLSKPTLLCTSDISTDPEDWINLGICRYYGLNSLRVKDSDQSEVGR